MYDAIHTKSIRTDRHRNPINTYSYELERGDFIFVLSNALSHSTINVNKMNITSVKNVNYRESNEVGSQQEQYFERLKMTDCIV